MSNTSETRKPKPDSSGGWKKITTIEIIRTGKDGTETRSIRTITESGSGNLTDSDSETEGLRAGIQKTSIGHRASSKETNKAKAPTSGYHGSPTRKGPASHSGSDSDSDSEDKQFAEECLAAHNRFRVKHRVPPLKLSKQLNKHSKEWAQKLARDDQLAHRPQNKYGENVYCAWSSDPKHQIKGTEAAEKWYSEVKDHKFGQEPVSSNTGHFTQVVWKESEFLGVAKARAKSGKFFVVANYEPAGNFVGKFTQNVLAP